MVEKELFFESHNEVSSRFLIIEEANDSIWAYLTFPNSTEIQKVCFLLSRVQVTKNEVDTEAFRVEGSAPPITIPFSTPFSQLPSLQIDDISAFWVESEDVLVSIEGNPFLFFIPDDSSRGFSKSISKDSFYGNAWDEGRFQECFLKGCSSKV